MMRVPVAQLLQKALAARTVVPAFNIPYLPMMAPLVQALCDTQSFGLIQVARLEWLKFESGSMQAIRSEYARVQDRGHTRLHLDHIPVVDEDGQHVDYLKDIREAIDLGFESVMVDGSRLPLAENIQATAKVAALAHAHGIPVEGELGAVLGHEAGPMPPYEELFASGRGFTDPEEAARFVRETGVDWLSVAIGNIHGAISAASRDAAKVPARLSIAHLDRIRKRTGIPLVLHGGSGIQKACLMDAFRHGVAKINIGTTLRQVYERGRQESIAKAQAGVYDAAVALLRNELEVAGTAALLTAPSP